MFIKNNRCDVITFLKMLDEKCGKVKEAQNHKCNAQWAKLCKFVQNKNSKKLPYLKSTVAESCKSTATGVFANLYPGLQHFGTYK